MKEKIQKYIKAQKEWIANVRTASEEVSEKWLDKVREANTFDLIDAEVAIPGITDYAKAAYPTRHIQRILESFEGKDVIPGDANLDKHIHAQGEIQKFLDKFEESLSAMEKAYGGKS